jgi:hypothetical protein
MHLKNIAPLSALSMLGMVFCCNNAQATDTNKLKNSIDNTKIEIAEINIKLSYSKNSVASQTQ